MANPEEQSKDQGQPQFAIQKIYVKDVSFETPNSPDVFTQEWKPEVNVELDSRSKLINEDIHEVVLGVTVTAKFSEKMAFLAEIQQAGIFVIKNFQENDRAAMIGSYCPSLLFPFAREAISDLVTKGGFPQFLLQPVNFDALYQQHLSRVKNQGNVDESDEPVH